MEILKKILGGGNLLYYPGCLTKFATPELKAKYEELLRSFGIDFIQLSKEELCCGSPVKNSGAQEDFIDLAGKNLDIFKQHGVGKIVSNCPSCVAVFKLDYAKVLGDKWDIEVQHVSELMVQNMDKVKKAGQGKKAAFHDPCHLGRVLGIYDQPRQVIEAAGYKLVEMELSREKSFCCGAGGGVKSNEPELANRIGKDRVTQAENVGADVLLTNCPMCYKQLKENSKIKVLELVELFQ